MKLNIFFILMAAVFASGKPVSEQITTTLPPTTVEPITEVPTTTIRVTEAPTTTTTTTQSPTAPTTAAPTNAFDADPESPHIVQEVLVLAPPEEISMRDLKEQIIREVEEEIMRDEEEADLVREMEEVAAAEAVRKVASEVASEGADVVIVRPLIAEGRHARCRFIRQSERYPYRRRQGFQRPSFAPSRPSRPARPFRPRPSYLRPVEEEPQLQIIF